MPQLSDPPEVVTAQLGRHKLAADTIRQTTKWILTVAAGLGSVLIAGLRFGDLGRLTAWTSTFWVALGGVSAALVAVGFTLAMASRVLTVRYHTLRQVVAELSAVEERKPGLPARVTSKLIRAIHQELYDVYEGMADDPRDLFGQIRALDGDRRRERDTGLPPAPERAAQQGNSLQELRQAAEQTADFADYWEADRRFKMLLWSLPAAGVVIVVGVLTFALAINRSAAPKVTLNQTPIPVEIVLSPAGQSWAIHALGCKPTRLPAIAIGGTLDAPEVVVNDGGGCHASRFVVTSDRGIVIPTPGVPTTR